MRQLLRDVSTKGAGERYLIQHSAGSGKSNSIAWLARQLIGLQTDAQTIFDSTIIVTDRRVLDSQINETVRQFTQVGSTVGHAESGADLKRLITEGKRIIITTVQKFPVIAKAMAEEHLDRKFAIIIDEAHSSQGGRTTADMHAALGSQTGEEEDEDTFEDQINQIIEQRKMLGNASYFAFTATPKNKTLELFGEASPQPDGTVRHLPFHIYSMKQAIQEGFILDVLENYTSIRSYFNLVKKIQDDPEFDSKRAQRRLRHYVEGHEYAVRSEAEIMVDHFHESIFSPQLMGAKARAMVVTDGVDRAIDYYLAMSEYIQEKGLPFRAIIAFSGERDHDGTRVSEAFLNKFPSGKIPEMIQQDPYRILICADKFQTGYDEPLLNTMYVDKTLGGIKAVQTLSRLNRQAPNKDRVFVLDFMNNPDAIQAAFEDYYQTTILADETDPNKLHDLPGYPGPAPGLLLGTGGRLCGSLLERRQHRPVGPRPGRMRGGVPEAGRGRAGGVQELGQGVHKALRLPVPGTALREPPLGEALDIPEFPDRQAARPGGAGPLPGSAGSCGYGQLPDGAEGGPEHQPGRGGRRDKPSPPGRWRRNP